MNTRTPSQRTASPARRADVLDQEFSRVGLNTNLFEVGDTYIVQLGVPGVRNVSSLQVQVLGNQLTVKGMMEIPTRPDATYIFRGLESSELSESFTLPADVDGERASACYVLGILTITLPKAEHVKPHTVKVSSAH